MPPGVPAIILLLITIGLAMLARKTEVQWLWKTRFRKVILIIIIIIWAFFGTWEIISSKTSAADNTQRGIDTTVATTGRVEKKVDTSNVKLDSVLSKLKNPFEADLGVCATNGSSILTNPFLIKDNAPNHFKLVVQICNVGKGVAYNIFTKYVLVSVRLPDSVRGETITSSDDFRPTRLSPNANTKFSYPFIRIEKDLDPNRLYFFCYKFKYRDDFKIDSFFAIWDITHAKAGEKLFSPSMLIRSQIETDLSASNTW